MCGECALLLSPCSAAEVCCSLCFPPQSCALCRGSVYTHSAGEMQSEFRASGTHGRKCAQITQARAVALQIHCLAAAARQP